MNSKTSSLLAFFRNKLLVFLVGFYATLAFSKLMNYMAYNYVSFARANSSSQILARIIADYHTYAQLNEPLASGQSLVFVGVVTSDERLRERARAIHATWSHHVSAAIGRVAFYSTPFSSATSTVAHHTPYKYLPVVNLDDASGAGLSPLEKNWLMLKHMHDNYLDKYEWFMRVDDDTYVNTRELEYLLRSQDSSRVQFLGTTHGGNGVKNVADDDDDDIAHVRERRLHPSTRASSRFDAVPGTCFNERTTHIVKGKKYGRASASVMSRAGLVTLVRTVLDCFQSAMLSPDAHGGTQPEPEYCLRHMCSLLSNDDQRRNARLRRLFHMHDHGPADTKKEVHICTSIYNYIH